MEVAHHRGDLEKSTPSQLTGLENKRRQAGSEAKEQKM